MVVAPFNKIDCESLCKVFEIKSNNGMEKIMCELIRNISEQKITERQTSSECSKCVC